VSGDLPEIALINLGPSSESGRRHADAWLSLDTGRDGEILRRSIAVRIGVPYRRLKILHEIGHFVDGSALPGRGFSSIEATDLHEWRLAVIESQLYAEPAEIEASVTGRDRDRLVEAQRFDELWALSYAHFIAMRSGDPQLLSGIRDTRIAQVGDLRYPLQWTNGDFTPIAASIDRLFGRIGWMVHL
jgi:hypothetical protein